MLTAETLHGKGLAVDLVHGTGRIGHRSHFVGVVLFPPVNGSGDIHRYENLADKLPVVASRLPQALCQIQIVGSQHIIAIFIVKTVYSPPAV